MGKAGKNARTARRKARRRAEANGQPVPAWAAVRAPGPRKAPKPQRSAMSRSLAVSIADSMDLPDGAYFAMIGDLMGGDYMDGIDAALAGMGDDK